jgi:hypothetical protein
MSVDRFEAPYALIFNLDQYAGNYEREFCAFVMGRIGDCGVGEEMLDLFEEDHPSGSEFWAMSDRCQNEPDDNGCYRPVSIYYDTDVDRTRYESLIIFFQTVPSEKEMAVILDRAKRFCAERPDTMAWKGPMTPLTLKGVRLISNKVERVIKTVTTYL